LACNQELVAEKDILFLNILNKRFPNTVTPNGTTGGEYERLNAAKLSWLMHSTVPGLLVLVVVEEPGIAVEGCSLLTDGVAEDRLLLVENVVLGPHALEVERNPTAHLYQPKNIIAGTMIYKIYDETWGQ
jgi:hypothetical protein